MATIKFWQEMQRVVTIDGQDKLMIGKNSTGEAQYVNVEDLNQFLSIAGIEIAPVPPGALPSGPLGVSRTMQLLNAGTWTFGGNSFVNPSGSIMKLWWNGSTWSLGGMVALPNGINGKTIEVFNSLKEGGYLSGDQILFPLTDGGYTIYQVKTGQTATTGQSPVTNPEKFDFIDIKDESKVAKNYEGDVNLYDGSTVSGKYIAGSNTPIDNANSKTTDWFPIPDDFSEYMAINANNGQLNEILWGDINKNTIGRSSGIFTGVRPVKGSKFCKFTIVFKNAANFANQTNYVVFVKKKSKPPIYYQQTPSFLKESTNPISGYVDITKPPYTNFVVKERVNLFNYKTVSKGYYYEDGGKIQIQPANGYGRVSIWIPCESDTFYTRDDKVGNSSTARGIGFYNENFEFISGLFTNVKTYKTPVGAAWKRLNVQEWNAAVSSEDNYRYLQIVKGQEAPTEYHEYDYFKGGGGGGGDAGLKLFNPSKESYTSGEQFVFSDDIVYEVKAGESTTDGQSPITNPEKFSIILNRTLVNFRKQMIDYLGLTIKGDLNTSFILNTGTNPLNISSNMLFHENHAVFNGKVIRKILCFGTIAGTMTILKCRNVNKVGYAEEVSVVVNVALGYNEIDVNIPLGANETIGFGRPTDTARIQYAAGEGLPPGGRLLLKNYTTGNFQFQNSTLCVGVYYEYAETSSDVLDSVVLLSQKLKGKKLSIISDSMSTFEGTIPVGNATYYPNLSSGVTSVEDMWWKKLLDVTGAELGTNDSWSGSRIANSGTGSLQTRLNVIDPTSDIALIFMGTNDFGNNVPLGDLSFVEPYDVTKVSGALCNALKVLTTNYPSTKFYGLTPLIRGDKGFPVVNSTGLSLDEYTNRMISIYRTFGVEVIDLRELSINTVNLGLFSADLLHMNKQLGMPRLANHVISKIHS